MLLPLDHPTWKPPKYGGNVQFPFHHPKWRSTHADDQLGWKAFPGHAYKFTHLLSKKNSAKVQHVNDAAVKAASVADGAAGAAGAAGAGGAAGAAGAGVVAVIDLTDDGGESTEFGAMLIKALVAEAAAASGVASDDAADHTWRTGAPADAPGAASAAGAGVVAGADGAGVAGVADVVAGAVGEADDDGIDGAPAGVARRLPSPMQLAVNLDRLLDEAERDATTEPTSHSSPSPRCSRSRSPKRQNNDL